MTKLYPIRIATGEEGQLVVQADADRFLVLDPGYATVGNVSARLNVSEDRTGSRIDKVFTWALAGKEIVAFADIRPADSQAGDQWPTGIVRFSAEAENGIFEKPLGMNPSLNNISDESEEISRKFHRLGYSYIASLGDVAFYILMNSDGYHLWRYEKDGMPEYLGNLAELVSSFQGRWTDPSSLPSYVTPQDYVSFMEVVEESAMPTGLYGWRDPASGRQGLYLLSRQPKDGATQWFLTELDPANGHGRGTVQIRSDAHHLFAVPGPQQWAFVEKGPAVGLQEQEVRSIYTIPAEKVRRGFDLLEKRGSKEQLDVCQ